MRIKVAPIRNSTKRYLWGCSNYPDCIFEEDTILESDPNTFYCMDSDKTQNSMRILYPEDIVPDAERHIAISNKFHYNKIDCEYQFIDEDFALLIFQLGFNNKSEFYFWMATQTKVITGGVHNYLPVGSPYYHIFTNMVKAINRDFGNIIERLFIEKKDSINRSVEYWLNKFQREKEAKEEKERQRHLESIERRANEATRKIFNAIRRKDIKAIIALRKSGADLTAKNENGLNSYEYAKTINNDSVLGALTGNIDED